MSTELIINASLPETRIALTENGEIQELLIERATGKGIVGNIYKGRVTRVLPGMQAAFVDIGLEKAAFLYVDDVYVHSEMWEEDEGSSESAEGGESEGTETKRPTGKVIISAVAAAAAGAEAAQASEESDAGPEVSGDESGEESAEDDAEGDDVEGDDAEEDDAEGDEDEHEGSDDLDDDLDEDDLDESDEGDDQDDAEEDDEGGPVAMGPGPSDGPGNGDDDDSSRDRDPAGTVSPEASQKAAAGGEEEDELQALRRQASRTAGEVYADEPDDSDESEDLADDQGESEGDEMSAGTAEGSAGEGATGAGGATGEAGEGDSARRRHRRGRRGGRNRRRDRGERTERNGEKGGERAPREARSVTGRNESETDTESENESLPSSYRTTVSDSGDTYDPNRPSLEGAGAGEGRDSERPGASEASENRAGRAEPGKPSKVDPTKQRPEFREQRPRDRRIKTKTTARPARGSVNIQDLLKEGQEVVVQVAKDPIATKGARLTCHISLPGRHLVCMPTIDHVGVSRRIERDEERRRLRDFVEKNRPRGLGFIVRTASGKSQSEKRVKQDIDYLTRLWEEIREKAAAVTAPALVYEDLNSVLRAIRDWVTEEIDKIVVDSRYHYNDIQRFVSHFMPSLKQKVELYHGDIPIFDAYNISSELSRALERKVWLKSGGYLVIDQAEALVAIDVNTGRYVGKKNLEDTILKTNLEAVQEIAYQLRLRNCGGIIILDLIDMEKEENKQRVYRALEEALRKDRARPSILKISELGLVEMTRKRTRDTIVRAMCESCSHCEGKGFIKSKQTVAYEVLRELEREGIDRDINKILVQAHSDVIDILALEERETLDQLERRYRKQIYLQAVGDYHPEQFEVSSEKKERSSSGHRVERISSSSRGGAERTEREGGGGREERGGRRGRGRNRDRDRDRERGGKDRERNAGAGNGEGGERAERGERDRPRGMVIRPTDPNGASGGASAGAGDSGADRADFSGAMNGAFNDTMPADGAGTGRAGRSGEEGFEEEDRLAFLRAQAAQDAALAGTPPAPGARSATPGAGGERERERDRERGGRGRRGGRGGRGRNGRDRDRNGPGTSTDAVAAAAPSGEGPASGGSESSASAPESTDGGER